MTEHIKPIAPPSQVLSMEAGDKLIDQLLAEKAQAEEEKRKKGVDGIQPTGIEDVVGASGGIEDEATPGFQITKTYDHYLIDPCIYLNRPFQLKLFSKLLDNGQNRTHTEWMTRSDELKLQIPSLPIYTSIIISLYLNRNHPLQETRDRVTEIKELFERDFYENRIILNSTTHLTPFGISHIYHGHKTSEHHIETGIIPQGMTIIDERYLLGSNAEPFFGYKDVVLIRRAYNWMFATTRSYLVKVQPDVVSRTSQLIISAEENPDSIEISSVEEQVKACAHGIDLKRLN